MDPAALTRALLDEAAGLGIDACGVCRAEPYAATERLIRERRDAGLFADMRFTMARPDRSCHPETLLAGARSVVAAARSYARPEPPKPDDRPRGRMPRYTRRDEYAEDHTPANPLHHPSSLKLSVRSFSSVISSMAYRRPSRPVPELLTPPYGM